MLNIKDIGYYCCKEKGLAKWKEKACKVRKRGRRRDIEGTIKGRRQGEAVECGEVYVGAENCACYNAYQFWLISTASTKIALLQPNIFSLSA